MRTASKNKNIRILMIGNQSFIESLKENKQLLTIKKATFQSIANQEKAVQRLDHNSYDILLLDDQFSTYKTTVLATMAYAMCRPTIVLCNSYLKILCYNFWKIFSPFSRKYKTSRKLIHFINKNQNYLDLLLFLSKNHIQYFDQINTEISKSTKF